MNGTMRYSDLQEQEEFWSLQTESSVDPEEPTISGCSDIITALEDAIKDLFSNYEVNLYRYRRIY